MDNKKLGYILLAIGILPILIAVFAIIEGITVMVLIRFSGTLAVSSLKTLIAIGFFLSLLTGIYLLKKR